MSAPMRRRSISASTKSPTNSWRRKSSHGRPSAASGTPIIRLPRRFPADDFAGLDFAPMQLVQIAGSADRAAGQWRLPGLSPGRLDGRLPLHRPRRQDDVAAQPHRGRRLAAFPCRASAARSLAAPQSPKIAQPSQFRPLSFAPPADWRAGDAEYQPAGIAMPCLTPDDAKRFAGNLAVRGGHRLHADRERHGDAHEARAVPAAAEERAMFSGHPCLTGSIATNACQPFNDRMKITGQFAAFAPSSAAPPTLAARRRSACRPGSPTAPAMTRTATSPPSSRASRCRTRSAGWSAARNSTSAWRPTISTSASAAPSTAATGRPVRPTISAARITCASHCRPTRRASPRSKASASARRPISSSRCASTTTPRLGRAHQRHGRDAGFGAAEDE